MPRGPRRSLRPRAETMWQPIGRTLTGAPGDMADFGRRINEPALRGDMRDRDQLGSPTDRALGREIERVLSSSV